MSDIEIKTNLRDRILDRLNELEEERKKLSILLAACGRHENQTKENCSQFSQCEWFPGGEERKGRILTLVPHCRANHDNESARLQLKSEIERELRSKKRHEHVASPRKSNYF